MTAIELPVARESAPTASDAARLCTVTRFSTNSGHGGNQRSAQLAEIHATMDQRNIELARTNPVGNVSLAGHFSRALLKHAVAPNMWFLRTAKRTPRHFPRQLILYQQALNWLKKHPDVDTVVLECAATQLGAFAAAKACNRKTVILPHNIESLVPNSPRSAAQLMNYLQSELSAFRAADFVYCICPEDCDLLRLFGIESHPLPYCPPSNHRQFLQGVRKSRASAIQDKLLIMGTTKNAPTRIALENLLKTLHTLPLDSLPPIHICGFGTDDFAHQFPDMQVVFEGSVSNERLMSLMVASNALIISQVATTGCLTRIEDSLHAGLPVICNYSAGRGHFAKEGLHLYESPNELYDQLRKLSSSTDIPPVPLEPVTDIQNYQQTMADLCR